MLVVTRKVDESIIISDNIEIVVLEITKDKVKIGISAPRDITIIRNELVNTQNSNRESSEDVPRRTIDGLLKRKNTEI